MRITSVFLAAAALCATSAAYAGDIVGKVYDAQGLPAAELPVTLSGLDRVAVTAQDGTYRFTDVGAGEQQLTITLADETLQRVWLDVGAEGESRRNIFLLSAAALENALDMVLQDEADDEAFEATLKLAERMSRENAELETTIWQWRDRDA